MWKLTPSISLTVGKLKQAIKDLPDDAEIEAIGNGNEKVWPEYAYYEEIGNLKQLVLTDFPCDDLKDLLNVD